MKNNDIDINHIMTWSQNKNYNMITKRKIKTNTATYKMFEKKYKEYFPNMYSYIDSIEDRDPISLEIFWIEKDNIKTMVYKNLDDLYVYRENNIVHCFELLSLKYMKQYNITNHPTTMEKLPSNIFDNINLEEEIKVSLESKALNVFNLLTNISIFIDSIIFIKLKEKEIDKLYYETHSFYHMNIAENIKSEINTFIIEPCEFYKMTNKQSYILDCYNLLLTCEFPTVKYMTCYIVVGGLTTVSPKIKKLYPDIGYNI